METMFSDEISQHIQFRQARVVHLRTSVEKNTKTCGSGSGSGNGQYLKHGNSEYSDKNNDQEVLHAQENHKEEGDPNIVDWDGDNDPENPVNWSPRYKWLVTVVLGTMTFCVLVASSIFSTATEVTAELFGVSDEVMILGTSLFVLGFATGPPIWGPCSELFGRKYPLFTGFFIFAIFQIPVAVAQNIYTVMLCRFLGGFFGSAPLAIVGGTLADFFGPVDRGVAVCVFAGATFIGPVAGPIIGGFVVPSYLGWRWTGYLTAIVSFFFGTLGFIIVRESNEATILQTRAKKRKYATKNWALHAKADEKEVDLKSIIQRYFFMPFKMLVLEPILLLLTLYMSLVFGILYLFFESYPISFQNERGWDTGVGSLPFIGISIGVAIGNIIIAVVTKTRFARKLEEHGMVIPEERLPPMMFGGIILPIGLFWFAWTSNPNMTWVPQVISGIPIGCGILIIFLQGLNYIIDVYKLHANSAIAANSLVRSLAGAGFPLFATPLYHHLGVPWATSLLAFLCVVLGPVPILFFIFGKKLRSMSRFSPDS